MINNILYTGKINNKDKGQYKNGFNESFVIPINSKIGRVIYADVLPVIAKTIKIMINWKLEVIPHFCFNEAI